MVLLLGGVAGCALTLLRENEKRDVRAGATPIGWISDDLQRYTYLGLDDRHVDVATLVCGCSKLGM